MAGVFAQTTFSAIAADSHCDAKAASVKKCEKGNAAATAPSCEEKVVSKAGKPVAGAAKPEFIKKCEKDTKK